MMKIRFKVKHLVYIIVSILILILAMIYLVLPNFQYYAAQKAIKTSTSDVENKFKTAMDNQHLLAVQKRKLVESYLIDSDHLMQYDVMVGPSMIQWQDRNKKRILTEEEIKNYLNDYVKHASIDGYYENAVKYLVTLYDRDSEAAKIDSIFEQAIKRSEKTNDDRHADEIKLAYAQSKVSRQAYEEAEEILEKLSDQDLYYDFDAQVAIEKIKILLYEKKLDQAADLLEKTIENYQKEAKLEMETSEDMVGSTDTYQTLQALNDNIHEPAKLSMVKGQIKKNNGQPMKSAAVFLRSEEDVNTSVGGNDLYHTVTDNQGRYEINNVPQGAYQITLGLTFEQVDGWMWPSDMDEWIQIDGETAEENIEFAPLININRPSNQEAITSDRVEFTWDEVENAAYYKLNFGIRTEEISISTSFPEKFSDHKADIAAERLYLHEMTRLFEEDDVTEVNGATLLAFMNPDNQMTWSVEAYGDDDQLLTTSQGYRLEKDAIGEIPIFHLKTRKLNEADQALLAGKVKKALSLYKANYEADQTDLTSLIMITRLVDIEGDQAWRTYTEKLADETQSAYIKEMLETD